MPMFRFARASLFLIVSSALLIFPVGALALGPDEDPIPSFEHLQQQRDEVRNALDASNSSVTSNEDGAFSIVDASGATVVPTGARRKGAARLPELSATQFDATTGVMTFTWRDIGSLVVTSLGRRSPRSVFADGSVVSATGVANDVSEVTLASHEFLEQHLVVDEQHASNKEIAWSYRLQPPTGVVVTPTATGLLLTHHGVPILIISADIAVDEAGTEFPVTSTWNDATSTMTITYDGRGVSPTGDVAIDPIFKQSSLPGLYVMHACQVAQDSAACEAVPNTGLPPGFDALPSNDAQFEVGRTKELGIYIRGKAGASIPAGNSAEVVYEAPTDNKIQGAVLHATIGPSAGGFGCRPELLNKSTEGVYSLAQTPLGWGQYGQNTASPSRITVGTFTIDANGVLSGLHTGGASFAGIRFQNISDTAKAVADGLPICAMKGELAADGSQQSDLFTVYLHDANAPAIAHALDPATPVADQMRFIPENPVYAEQQWYRPGLWRRIAVEASDRGSGIDRVHVFPPNTAVAAPDNAIDDSAESLPAGTITMRLCEASSDTGRAPCPTTNVPGAADLQVPAGTEGINTLKYRAVDFAGNRTDSAELRFLVDGIAPSAPGLDEGTSTEPLSPAADAALPTFDTDDTVEISWSASEDPGATTSPPTGSGVAEYVSRLDRRTSYGVWVPVSPDHPETRTPPVRDGIAVPLRTLIPRREGIYRMSVRAVDRAGNESSSDVRYLRVDTTAPFLQIDPQLFVDGFEVRGPASPTSIDATIVDPSIGGGDEISPALAALNTPGNDDTLDLAVMQRSNGAEPEAWSDLASTAQRDKRWVIAGSSPVYTSYQPGPIASVVGEGSSKLRIAVRDGAKPGGGYWHNRESGAIVACIDTRLHQQTYMKPTLVSAVPVNYQGTTLTGALVRFDVPAAAIAQAFKWIVEVEIGGTWIPITAPMQSGLKTEYIVEDESARVAGTRYRVSAASQACTRRGDESIATVATIGGKPIDKAQPERSMPLLGLESRWSFWSIGTGAGTDASVNTATGNLVLSRPLLSEPGVGLWTNVQLTYNSQVLHDDESLAADGIAGTHFTLGVGPGASGASGAAEASRFRISDSGIVMQDVDGTYRVFEPTRATTNPEWNGTYRPADGARLVLRNVVVARQAGLDDPEDGVDGTIFKLTRQDGVTYYYGRQRSINGVAQSEVGRLLAVRDREGHQLTYAYECVAVMPIDGNVIRAYRVHPRNDGTWHQVPESEGARTVAACPANTNLVQGASPAADLRMRLVAVRDHRYGGDTGREVRISYNAPTDMYAGHIRMIRGHETNDQSRRVYFDYEEDEPRDTVRLRKLTLEERRGDTRTIDIKYEATMSSLGPWIDRGAIVRSVSDFQGRHTRFSYSLPDADAGSEFAQPRIDLVENRSDVLRNGDDGSDGVGMSFDYRLRPGTDSLGNVAMRLGGGTTRTDHLGRSTRYEWNYSDVFLATFGRTDSIVEPGGVINRLEWNDNHELTESRRVVDDVVREPVQISTSGRSRVLTWPIDPNGVVFDDAGNRRFNIDSRGVITTAPPSEPFIVYVTYKPVGRTTTQVINRDAATGYPNWVTRDKRWSVALGNRERGDFQWYSDLPQTSLDWQPIDGPMVTRSIVRDLKRVTMPGGGARYTAMDVDARTGRVNRVDAPGGSGTRNVQTYSYYDDGTVRSVTDPLGWTVAYANYTDDGEPTLISRRFCVEIPSVTTTNCGTTRAGWSFTASESTVAATMPIAFRVTYTAEAEIECIRDVRGSTGAQDAARFVSFRYDGFGNVTFETSPWKTTGGKRIRRVTRHWYDSNGNRVRSVRDERYELGSAFDPSDCTTNPDSAGGSTVSRDERSLKDTEYDELDRVTVQRTPSNNIDGKKRVSRTYYDAAGNIVEQTEPNHEARSEGIAYLTRIAYDHRDRPFAVRDGEGRYTCTYYDAFDNPVAITPIRWQKKKACSPAPDLTRSTFASFDNAGNVVSSRDVAGKVTFNLTDADGNVVRSEESGGERVGRGTSVVADLRVTTRIHDAAGNVIRELLPPRVACVKGNLAGCSSTQQTAVTPELTYSYDALSRMVESRTARQNVEQDLLNSTAAQFDYDADGRRITETIARDGGTARTARTVYDPYGNPVEATLPIPANADDGTRDRFTTFFTYGDDDALLTKNDRAHDVLTTWGYDLRGRAISRTEHGSGDEDGEWDSRHSFAFYDDGSLKRAPMSIARFEPNRIYADRTCLRAPGSSATPSVVYLVLGDQQFSRTGRTPVFGSDTWDVGETRRSGRVRLRKLEFDAGAERTYDENGLPLTVRACGSELSWPRRNGVGDPLEITNQDGGDTTFLYDDGGNLTDVRYPDGRARTARHTAVDDDPFTIDPGAGFESVISLDRPNLKQRYLQMTYEYTLDGAIDIEGRASTGGYTGSGATIKDRSATGFTTHEYDHVGALAQTRVLRPPTVTAKRAVPNRSARAARAKAGKAPNGRAVGQNGTELLEENVLRDVAGNPRRVVTTLVRAKIAAAKASRTQTRSYSYDVLDRLVSDDVSSLDPRSYRFDDYGRLDKVLVGATALEDYGYSDSASRGSMLTRSVVRGLTDPTRQLTVMEYGNGRLDDGTNSVLGPRGQLVRSTTYSGKTSSTGLSEITTYRFTPLNQQAAAVEQVFEPARERQSRRNRARKRTDQQRSYMHYDALGRRVSTNDMVDDLSDTTRVRDSATLSYFVGESADPYVESTDDDHQPGARWIMRANGKLVGELREHSARYHVGNHQGSTVMSLGGNNTVSATFDYDTWGEPITGPISLESGSKVEQTHNVYSFTGMRKTDAGNTTHHHARDYNASLKTWLQTDQYMDPWADLGLSMDPTTRDRHGYAMGNPVANVDTNGHDTTPSCSKGFVAVRPAPDKPYQCVPGKKGSVQASRGGSGIGPGDGDTVHSRPSKKALREMPAVVQRNIACPIAMSYTYAGYGEACKHALNPNSKPMTWSSVAGFGFGAAKWYFSEASNCAHDFGINADCGLAAVGVVPIGKLTKGIKPGWKWATSGGTRTASCMRSFSSTTTVIMADGTRKPISQIQIGDWVLAADEATGTDPQPRRVTAVWKHYDDLMYLYTSAGRVTTTNDHPFFNASTGEYEHAAKLGWGTSLRSADGARITAWGNSPESMRGLAYNLTVEGRHTYYVGVGPVGSALVHNCNPLTTPQMRDLAGRLGLRETNQTMRGEKVFTDGKRFFVQDTTSHSGGVFKGADSIAGLGSKNTRLGTYDHNLNLIGP